MGSMELLSREGEVAIAKRIEAGREAMMAGLCESPLTFQAITIWRDELYGGKIFLRDIIDLDAINNIDPDATNNDRGVRPSPLVGSDIDRHPISDYLPGQPDSPPRIPALPSQRGTDGKPIGDRTPTDHEVVTESDIDEDDVQKWLSISAMEAELKPRVFETFNSIADSFKRLRRLQELNIQGKLRNERLSPAQERNSKE
jgi:RNA polymerase primary sigma factor